MDRRRSNRSECSTPSFPFSIVFLPLVICIFRTKELKRTPLPEVWTVLLQCADDGPVLIADCRMKLPFIQILHIRSVKCRDICRCWMQDCLVNSGSFFFLLLFYAIVNNLLLLVCRLKSWKLWSDQFNSSHDSQGYDYVHEFHYDWLLFSCWSLEKFLLKISVSEPLGIKNGSQVPSCAPSTVITLASSSKLA